MTQLSFLDAIDPPPTPIAGSVDPNGHVIPSQEVQERIILRHPKMAWHSAEIELHQHIDGLWMWSGSACSCDGGFSYGVGPKWGKFARTRRDALWLAADEIENRLNRRNEPSKEHQRIVRWCQEQKQISR